MVEYGDAVLLITLMELLTKYDYSIEHGAVGKEKVALDGWHVLVMLLDLIPPGANLASRLVNQHGLLGYVLSDLLWRNGDLALFSVELSCILSLKRHNITLPSDSGRIIQAITDMLTTPCEWIPMTPLFQVLRALSLENKQLSETTMRAVRSSLDERSSDFQDVALKSVLQCYKSVGKTRSSSLRWEDPTK